MEWTTQTLCQLAVNAAENQLTMLLIVLSLIPLLVAVSKYPGPVHSALSSETLSDLASYLFYFSMLDSYSDFYLVFQI